MIISIESFTTNLTREPIVPSVDKHMIIFVLNLCKCFLTIVTFISYTCMLIHVIVVVATLIEGFLALFAVVQLNPTGTTWFTTGMCLYVPIPQVLLFSLNLRAQ